MTSMKQTTAIKAIHLLHHSIFHKSLTISSNTLLTFPKRLISSSSSCMNKTHYEILELTPTATEKEIKESYINLTKRFHPDTNLDDPSLHKKFVRIKDAYSVLSSPYKRRDYDRIMGFHWVDNSLHNSVTYNRARQTTYKRHHNPTLEKLTSLKYRKITITLKFLVLLFALIYGQLSRKTIQTDS